MSSVLNLAALIAMFDRCQHTAQLSICRHSSKIAASTARSTAFSRANGEHVHGVFEEDRFIEQDRLAMRGRAGSIFARSRKWLVGAVE